MNLTLTAEVIADLAGQGRYWWATPAGDCYATATKTPATQADIYLLDASPTWIGQWGGDWNLAAAALAPLLTRIEGTES